MAQLQQLFNTALLPLPAIENETFGSHFDTFGDKQVVLLGDGSHGTSEFYRARAEITKRLIERHGYKMVAVEADWPDAEAVDRYVRQRPDSTANVEGATKGYEPFMRFPTWMWRNREMQDLVEWMRNRNQKLPPEARAGFYGLDIYSMGASIQAVIDYLDRVDPKVAKEARRRYGCLQPWVDDPTAYGLASLRGMKGCERPVMEMLRDMLERRLENARYDESDWEEHHSSEQNAFIVHDAEQYYKAMYYSSASSWTLRDTHMFETLSRLLAHNPATKRKAIVWAHNSHVGDARYTAMGSRRNEVNIGQLCRERLGRENVAIIGCGTHTGTVAAAHDWDENMEVMAVRPSRDDSWEMVAHSTGIPRFLLDIRYGRIDPNLRAAMSAENRPERFIGVIYRPDTERISHYSQSILHEQFDAYVWFDCTESVKPLEVFQPDTPLGNDETYPFGL